MMEIIKLLDYVEIRGATLIISDDGVRVRKVTHAHMNKCTQSEANTSVMGTLSPETE